MPLDSEQRRIVRLIKAEGRKIKNPQARKRYVLAAVQTGLVESHLHNLSGGDRDSAGWRQERASIYGTGKGGNTDVKAGVRRFRQEFEQHYDPGEASYEVAAQVQRPAAQYRGRYKDVRAEAKRIAGNVRGGSPSPVGPDGAAPAYGQPDGQLKQQALVGYLGNRGKPGALLQLKAGLDAAQGQPAPAAPRRNDSRNPSSPRGHVVKGPLREMFYNGPGGINVDEGKRVDHGYVDGHGEHVHVAGQQRDMKVLGKLAQRMGLTVRENPAFDPVDPVHTRGSFHYGRREGRRNYRALDVSGDPDKLLKFNQRVARAYGA